MLCPRCKGVLQVRSIETVEINQCLRCNGIWFDQDELRRAKDAVEPDLNWMDFEIWKHEDRFEASLASLPCPKCLVQMVAIEYGDTGVEIDYCTRCEGMWLDAGEFEKIIDALEGELAIKSTSDYVKASLEEAREIIEGPESLISEWRDFMTVVRLLQYRVLVGRPEFREVLAAIQRGAVSL